jgi:hypothetical protein
MKRHFIAFAFVSSLVGVACGDMSPETNPIDEEEGHLGIAENALDFGRYCTSQLNCAPGCMCSGNQCIEDGFGGSPDCSAPPQRTCTTHADCRSMCDCWNGVCQPDMFGPQYSLCHLPPPDTYETDNTPAQAKNYLGSPQTGKNFHELGDEDWTLVYFGVAGVAKFETYNLTNNADTYLEVFKYSNGTAGTPVGFKDNVCTTWNNSQCLASKVTLSVPAKSLYLVRVTNKNSYSHNEYNQVAPGYSLRIYY